MNTSGSDSRGHTGYGRRKIVLLSTDIHISCNNLIIMSAWFWIINVAKPHKGIQQLFYSEVTEIKLAGIATGACRYKSYRIAADAHSGEEASAAVSKCLKGHFLHNLIASVPLKPRLWYQQSSCIGSFKTYSNKNMKVTARLLLALKI